MRAPRAPFPMRDTCKVGCACGRGREGLPGNSVGFIEAVAPSVGVGGRLSSSEEGKTTPAGNLATISPATGVPRNSSTVSTGQVTSPSTEMLPYAPAPCLPRGFLFHPRRDDRSLQSIRSTTGLAKGSRKPSVENFGKGQMAPELRDLHSTVKNQELGAIQWLVTHLYSPPPPPPFLWGTKIILGSAHVNRISNPQSGIRHWLFLKV